MFLKDKVCIISGAGKGIGRDCAKLFAKHGAKLALISRSENDLSELADELYIPSDSLFIMSGDVSSRQVIASFVSQVIEKFSRVDVLVNNAGIRMRKPFLDMEEDDWDNILNVNAKSVFNFCQIVGKHMCERGQGKVINMASIAGTLGLSELTGYCASKGAVISLTKSLAVEWASKGINVNVIVPGFCETSYAESFKQKKELYQYTLDNTPMGKWGKSRDISNACLYLASEMSDYVTGETLTVDGGWSAG